MSNKPESIDDLEAELLDYGDRSPPRRAWIDIAHRLHDAHARELTEWENLRKAFEAIKGLDDNQLLPDKISVCPPTIDDDGNGYSPENHWCKRCKSDTKKKCIAIYNARQVLLSSACRQPVTDCNSLKKALATCYEALEFVTRPRERLSPYPDEEVVVMRTVCRDALLAAKAAEREAK